MTSPRIEDLLRDLAPQVLGVLVRRYGDFDTAEDAVQEALLAAATQWPDGGVPANPRGWLIRVAVRRMADQVRAEQSRRRREDEVAARATADTETVDQDDTLVLLLLCCHPVLTPASAIALTLRAVGGLTTGEIANAFLVPEPTMAQRISRAKQRIAASGSRFAMPSDDERAERLRSVLHVLYLIFNEGYASSSGDAVQRVDLSAEAIRLAREAHRLVPDDPEVTGLLALLLLTDARRPARTGPHGELIPLTEQDRTRWDQALIVEGIELLRTAMAHGSVGYYQLQAAIAAVHDDARTPEETDWPQIRTLYGLLERMAPQPIIALNRVIATAMVEGPRVGLEQLDAIAHQLDGHHRLHATRAHLLEMSGALAAAVEQYRVAAARTTSTAEQRYLIGKAAELNQRL